VNDADADDGYTLGIMDNEMIDELGRLVIPSHWILFSSHLPPQNSEHLTFMVTLHIITSIFPSLGHTTPKATICTPISASPLYYPS